MGSGGENPDQDSSLKGIEKKSPPSYRQTQPIPSPPLLSKFAQNLRRDLLLSNFDRNLTIEQAHFDATLTLPVSQDHSSPTGIYDASSSTLSSHSISHHSSNTDLNSDITNNNNNNNNLYSPNLSNISVPMLTPPAEPPYLSRRTSNSKMDTKRKQPKRSPMNSTATPSEYFHRNLVDAVYNVEASDENEYFVYPYSEHHNNVSDYHGPLSPRLQMGSKKLHTNTLHSSHELNDTITTPIKPHRPKLRSYVMDPHLAKKDYGTMKASKTTFSTGSPLLYSNRHSYSKTYLPIYQLVTDRYASDDEGELLVRNNAYNKCNICQWMTRLPLLAICSFTALFVLLGLIIRLYGGAQPLHDVTIGMEHVLASDKELIFDLHVTAYNPNGWTVHIADVEMNVFGVSEMNGTTLTLELDTSSFTDTDSAAYLGTVYYLDEPLAFYSSIFSSKSSQAISQIRIKSPGNDERGNKKWSQMIRYPYDLLVRGILSYHSGIQSQAVSICHTTKVDPSTGIIPGDPNQGFCSMDNQLI